MEEAELLKERIQAITDKRRIQEDIAKKRRQIEEEKLKLQYIKKKALREQWLMDGLSQQTEEEQEAMRLQAQDEQQQSDQLQSNILRIEKEIEALEQKELSISSNEEMVLKRLKEVERTPEDIIKELQAAFQADFVPDIEDVPLVFPPIKAKSAPVGETNGAETKKATFAVKISVEYNRRTGKNQVVSSTAISPGSLQQSGLKIYDDGRKSVFALQSEEDSRRGEVGQMSSHDVEELLHQAAEEAAPAEVHFHRPVFSAPYTGSNRPCTPRAPTQIPVRENTPSIPEQMDQKTPAGLHQSCTASERHDQAVQNDRTGRFGTKTSPDFPASSSRGAPVPVMMTSQATPASMTSGHWSSDPDLHSSASESADGTLSNHDLHTATGSSASLNQIQALPEEPEQEPLTMIFIGYENASDEEEEDIQAELVIIGASDGEDEPGDANRCLDRLGYKEEQLSFHPEGCKSQVFQPKVEIATVGGGREAAGNIWDVELHRPTFVHRPGKHSCYQPGERLDEPPNIRCITEEKLRSTRR
uniref:Palmdelphin n=2 Tax=Cyprinodon variegatus TaxID=28743 RepID=A0A3Q2D6W1_CYPVA